MPEQRKTTAMTAMTLEVREAMERRRQFNLWKNGNPLAGPYEGADCPFNALDDLVILADYALATTDPGKRVVSVELAERLLQFVNDKCSQFVVSDLQLLADLRAVIAEQGSETPKGGQP